MKYLLVLLSMLFLVSCDCNKKRDCTGQEDKIDKLVKECVAGAKGSISDNYDYRRVLDSCMSQYKALYCPYEREEKHKRKY